LATGLVSLASTSSGLALALARRTREAAWAMLFGLSLSAGVGLVWSSDASFSQGATMVVLMAVVFAPFLLSTRVLVLLVVANVLMVTAAYLKLGFVDGAPAAQIVPTAVGTSIVLVVAAGSIAAFVRHAQQNQAILRERLHDIDQVMERARRIATGDLTGGVEREGDVGEVVSGMLGGLRGLVEQIQVNSARVATASREIAAMSQQQERSAVEQGGAIEETRRTVAGLLESS